MRKLIDRKSLALPRSGGGISATKTVRYQQTLFPAQAGVFPSFVVIVESKGSLPRSGGGISS